MSERRTESRPDSATERLLRAVAEGDADGVRASLTAGADLNARYQSGQTALTRAAFFGFDDVVRVLLAGGAEVSAKDELGLTAHEWATRRGFIETSRLLQSATSIVPIKTTAPRETAAPRENPRVEPPPPPPPPVAIKEETLEVPDAAPAAPEHHEPTVSSPATTTSPAIKLDPPAKSPVTKHCPVCKRTYDGDNFRSFCSYHPALLVEGPADYSGAPTPRVTLKNFAAQHGRPLILVLVAVFFVVGLLIGDFISDRWLKPSQVTSGQQQATAAPNPTADKRPPVVNGAVKGREKSLPEPEYPAEARRQGLVGEITVSVSVNRKGRVVAAQAMGGPLLLQQAAEGAAREASFAPSGRAATRSGTITYNFK